MARKVEVTEGPSRTSKFNVVEALMGEIEMKHIAGVKVLNPVLRTDKPT